MKLVYLFTIFLLMHSFLSLAQQEATITFNGQDTSVTISRNIYGHFAEHLGRCIYDGITRNGSIRMDVVKALKKIRVPNLRWPGGCFADQYHWKDGIGDKTKRPVTINTNWGMVKEDNSFGTHEFMELCSLLGCEPYIAANVGTGTPEEMSEWIEYLNYNGASTLTSLRAKNGHPAPFKVSLWGVGNESWGCGGNMQPEYYAGLYKQFATFCQNYSGAPLKKIISGPNGDDYKWTEVMMKNIDLNEAWGLSMHYYTVPTGNWDKKGSATQFTEAEYAHTMKQALRMEEIVSRHEVIMDRYDPQKKLALLVDEWGIWTDVEPGTNPAFLYQQNSLRDALVAATTLNIFNNHADRIRAANIAQVVNVLQALILTKGDQMILTPTYHVFDLYKVHQDAKLVRLKINSPLYISSNDTVNAVNASASMDVNGRMHISIVNLDPQTKNDVHFSSPHKKITGQVLSSPNLSDINSFERPGTISITRFTGFTYDGNDVHISLPPKSVVVLELTEP